MIAALDRLRARFAACFQRRALDEDFDEELAGHFELLAEEYARSGYAPAEARRRARQQLGGLEQTRELHRHARGIPLLEQFGRDLKFAWSLLRGDKTFATVCILTIALAIAACATVFSVLDGALFRPLPYASPDRIVTIWEVASFGENSVSGGAFSDWRERSETLETIMIHAPVTQNLRREGGAARLRGWEASASLLDVLGISPLLGRGFLPSEEQVNGAPVVMLTEEAWRARFGADPAIVGSSIALNETFREVVGILPANAWLEPDVEFFIPAILNPEQQFRSGRSTHWAHVWGRLKPNVSPQQLEAELKSIKAGLDPEYPAYKRDWSVAVHTLRETITQGPRPALWTLAGAVGLVLVIACANVANLLLARAAHRRGELAMRAALGASSGRIFRQSLTESLLLAGIGGGLGILLSLGGIQMIKAAMISEIPGAMAPALDGRVLAASVAITCGAALLFGVLPAWRSRKTDLNDTLKSGGRSATAGGRTLSQSLLVVTEVALTAVLLSSAGLLLRSLANVVSEHPGYNPRNTLAFDLTLPDEVYGGPEKRVAYTASVLERIRALPGVSSVGSLSASPLNEGVRGEYISREDRPETRLDYLASVIYVGGDFFQTLEARLLKGRFLDDRDNRIDAAKALVIDSTLAARLFPEDEPVGQLLNYLGEAWEIVGVVEAMKLDHRPRPDGYLYAPHASFPFSIGIVVRLAGEPAGLIEQMRDAVASVDSGVPMANLRSLEDALDNTRQERRFVLALIGGFAAAALLLACAGLYGVMSYTTATRHRELCIRRALGATPGGVIRLVAKDGGRLTALGLILGLLAAAAAARLLSSQLYQVSAYDPVVLGGALAIFAGVSLLACWAPARRAARVDPSAGLRSE